MDSGEDWGGRGGGWKGTPGEGPGGVGGRGGKWRGNQRAFGGLFPSCSGPGLTGILQQDDIVIYIIYSCEVGFSRMSLFWVVLAQLPGVSKALTTKLVNWETSFIS